MKKKAMRGGFLGLTALLALIFAIGIIGTAIQSPISVFVDRQKVDDLVQKEYLLRDAFVNYYTASDYNMSATPQTAEALISAAINDKILPKISSGTGVTTEDIAYYRSNNFGGAIEIGLDGAILNIESEIPSAYTYARKYYQSVTGKLYPSYLNGSKLGHKYALAGDMMKHVQMTSAVAQKATTAGASLDPTTAIANGTQWWDYNPANDTYQVKTWDGAKWVTQKTVYANTSDTNSNGGGGGGGPILTAVGDPSSINPANVEEGTVLTAPNGQQYVSMNGAWKPLGSTTLVGDVNSTSATSVADGSTLVQTNPDGTVTTYINIGGQWYPVGGGGGGGFVEPVFTLPTMYPKGTYSLSASHPSPSLVSGYQWEVVGSSYSLSSLTTQNTSISLLTANVGDSVSVKARAISTAGVASNYVSKTAVIQMPTPIIQAPASANSGETINLSGKVLAADGSTEIVADSYAWSASSGVLSATDTQNVTLTMPSGGGNVTLTLTTVKNGLSSQTSLAIGNIPAKPTLVLSKSTATMGDADFTIDADSSNGLVSSSNNEIGGESEWEVVITKHDGSTVTYNSEYFTLSSSELGDSYIGSLSAKARYKLNGVWSLYSNSVSFSVKPLPPTLTIPSIVYYDEQNVQLVANRNGVTGSAIMTATVNGSVASGTDNITYWNAPSIGTATVEAFQVKNGQTSVSSGIQNINLVNMNYPALSTAHYVPELSASPQFMYFMPKKAEQFANPLTISFIPQGSGAATYLWENQGSDEADVAFGSASSQSTNITCSGSGKTSLKLSATHRGVTKSIIDFIECDGFETLEY